MTRRLSDATLQKVNPAIAKPAYDRVALCEGVVHLGLGAFTRAHQCVAFDDLASQGDLRWGVVGVSLRSTTVRDSLAPQDNLYTLVARDGDDETARIVGIITRVLVAPEDVEAVIAALAQPSVRLVTLTVTEKGYHLDRAAGVLDLVSPAIARDIADSAHPATAPGLLVAALRRRRAAGVAPPVIMSCDNLTDNGTMLRAAVIRFAKAVDPELAEWIADTVHFPSTMVDRIVPALTAEERERFARRWHYHDAGLIVTELFTQWIVETHDDTSMPDLAAAGATLVADVAPWEKAKLRMLNGAHSMIAYTGALAGIDYVHEYVAHSDRRAQVEALWDEVEVTLDPADGLDVAAYRRALMARFANPSLRHRTVQIAADGSQKLPQRLVSPLIERSARGLASPKIAQAIAGWMHWQRGILADGALHPVDDPLADRTREIWGAAVSPMQACSNLLAIAEIFPPDTDVRGDILAAMEDHRVTDQK